MYMCLCKMYICISVDIHMCAYTCGFLFERALLLQDPFALNAAEANSGSSAWQGAQQPSVDAWGSLRLAPCGVSNRA